MSNYGNDIDKIIKTIESEIGALEDGVIALGEATEALKMCVREDLRHETLLADLRSKNAKLELALKVLLAARPSLTDKGWDVVKDATDGAFQ